jgi:apolipoprotein D and lipocalin family protein
MRKLIVAVAVAALAVAGAARAAAPEPRKPIDAPRFMGRWYEILRTPSGATDNCFSASQVWSQKPDGDFAIVQRCHKGAPDGPVKLVQTKAKPLNADHTKWEASFFGGLIRKKYWVIDRADDYSWMIASTSGGGYVSLLARQPGLGKGELNRLTARIASLGFDTARLQSVGVKLD